MKRLDTFWQPLASRAWHGVAGGARARIVDLHDMPRGVRLLAVFGYAGVAVLLFAALTMELFGDLMPGTRFVSTVGVAVIPLPAVAASTVAYVAGWTLVLTGASDCRRRVFLPVVGVYLIHLLLGDALIFWNGGVASAASLALVIGAVIFPAAIHLFVPNFRFWKELPLVEASYWAFVTSSFVVGVWVSGGSTGVATTQMYLILSELLLLSAAFWLLLALDVVDLAADVSRPAISALRGKGRRDEALRISLAPTLLFYPAALFLLLRTSEGLLMGVMLFCGFMLSLPLAGATLVLLVARRWTVGAATTLLALAFASSLLSFGISLSLGGQDFAEFALSATGVIPPLTLFAGLMTYDVLNFGLRFANRDGRLMPRSGRILLYLGAATLVIGYALFFLCMSEPTAGRSSEELQVYVNGTFMLGVLFLGPPYLAWIAWKRRERLVGAPKLEESEQHHTERSASADETAPKNVQ